MLSPGTDYKKKQTVLEVFERLRLYFAYRSGIRITLRDTSSMRFSYWLISILIAFDASFVAGSAVFPTLYFLRFESKFLLFLKFKKGINFNLDGCVPFFCLGRAIFLIVSYIYLYPSSTYFEFWPIILHQADGIVYFKGTVHLCKGCIDVLQNA